MLKNLIFTLALLALFAMIGFTSLLLVGGMDFQSAGAREEKAAAPNSEVSTMKAKRKVAIFIYKGVKLLGVSGPGEDFASTIQRQAFEVYTVAASLDQIVSQ